MVPPTRNMARAHLGSRPWARRPSRVTVPVSRDSRRRGPATTQPLTTKPSMQAGKSQTALNPQV